VKRRVLFFYKDYFNEFFSTLNPKTKKKVLWVLKFIEELDRIPEIFLKHIENSGGLYEIRVQLGNNIYRIFCFFEEGNILIIGHGFQKKTQKTPAAEIEKAIKIKKAYYEEKRSYKS